MASKPKLQAKPVKTDTARVRLDPTWRDALQRSAAVRTARLNATARAGVRGRKLTESDLIREAIAAYLGRADQVPAPEQAISESELAPAKPLPLPSDPVDAQLQRVRLQLPAFLINGMTERARELGMRPAAWLAALMQFNLARVPVLATAELFGLREATRELRAIGHNLNQLTRLANEAALIGGQHAAPELPTLQALSAQVDQLREQIRATVRASQGVWRTAE
jgi:hypothetical protein